MNTTKLIIALFVAVLLTIICPVAFGKTTTESPSSITFEESFLDLSGVMTIDGEKTAEYTVHIFQDGSPSDTFQVNSRVEQHFVLPIGHNYALKFSKPGYKDRIMLVNTMIPEKNIHDMYTFRYSIEFIACDEANTFDDFPVAFVQYDELQKDFDYNRTYHKNVRTDLDTETEPTASRSWH